MKFIIITGLFFFVIGAAMAGDLTVVIGPDENMETVSALFHLAGNKEYKLADDDAFQRQYQEKFAEFAAHPAVLMARFLRKHHGISYDRVTGLGANLQSCDPFVLRHDSRYLKDWPSVDEFALLLAQFHRETGFHQFYRDYIEPNPLLVANRRLLEETTATVPYVEWLENFFIPETGEIRIMPSMFGDGGNAAHLAETRCLRLSVQPSEPDIDRAAEMQALAFLIVHEYTHTETNPLVSRNYAEFSGLAKQVFPLVKLEMDAQAYGTPSVMMIETFVRAVDLVFLSDTFGRAAADKQLKEEEILGFILVKPLFEKILSERQRHGAGWTFPQSEKAYVEFLKTLDVQPILDGFNQSHREPASVCTPPVVTISPGPGEKNVSPLRDEIVIQLDRPVKSRCVMSPLGIPPAIEGVSQKQGAGVVKVKLQPETAYALLFLFSPKEAGDTTEFEPFLYTFTTGKMPE